MVDGEECSILAAVDGGGVAWTGLELEVEHGVGRVRKCRVCEWRMGGNFIY